MSVEAPRSVRCGSCGAILGLSARNVRAARQRGEEPLCASCRLPERKVDEAERAKMVRWWLEESGLELEELQAIARLLWPDVVPNPCPNVVIQVDNEPARLRG